LVRYLKITKCTSTKSSRRSTHHNSNNMTVHFLDSVRIRTMHNNNIYCILSEHLDCRVCWKIIVGRCVGSDSRKQPGVAVLLYIHCCTAGAIINLEIYFLTPSPSSFATRKSYNIILFKYYADIYIVIYTKRNEKK